MKKLPIAATTMFAVTLPLSASFADQVPYPEGYRNWTHAKSMVIQPGHPLENPFQGIHHVYANPSAMQGLESGNYPDGAEFVFDLLNYTDSDKTLQEGDRKLIGVMQKDKAKYASTGGWGYEAFAGDSNSERIVNDGGAGCFGCHTQQQDKDYVFTQYRK